MKHHLFQKGPSTACYLFLFRPAEPLEGAARAEEQAINTERKNHSRNSSQNLSPLSLPPTAENADGGRQKPSLHRLQLWHHSISKSCHALIDQAHRIQVIWQLEISTQVRVKPTSDHGWRQPVERDSTHNKSGNRGYIHH